jgi:hypothetical protein
VRSDNHAIIRPTPTSALTGTAGLAGAAGLAARHRPAQTATRRPPQWRWLLVGLLVLLSIGITIVYVATVTADIRMHHWAGALDASRDAVPAAVGWAALLIVFCARGGPAAEQSPGADELEITQRQQAADAQTSVLRAEQRVERLAADLADLSAAAAQASQNPQLARQISATAARLEQAEQWLIGARAVLAASRRDAALPARPDGFARPGRAA